MNEIDLDGMRSGGIAHDINNKLATIIGTVDLLLSQVDGQSEISDGLKDVLAAALKMQELVRTIPRRQLV
jgi:signal transduction histidine kinase